MFRENLFPHTNIRNVSFCTDGCFCQKHLENMLSKKFIFFKQTDAKNFSKLPENMESNQLKPEVVENVTRVEKAIVRE